KTTAPALSTPKQRPAPQPLAPSPQGRRGIARRSIPHAADHFPSKTNTTPPIYPTDFVHPVHSAQMFTHKAPIPLWREARELLSQLWSNFGAPSAMAFQGAFDKLNHDLLCKWLRGCEAMLRALLFMEAVELCVAGALPAPKQRTPRPRQPREKRVHD